VRPQLERPNRLLVEPEGDLLSRRFVDEEIADGVLAEVRRAIDARYKLLAAEELDAPAQRPADVDLDRAWQERSALLRTSGDHVTVSLRLNPTRRVELVATALDVLAEAMTPAPLRNSLHDRADAIAARNSEWSLQLCAHMITNNATCVGFHMTR
jgi:hypothetical protein